MTTLLPAEYLATVAKIAKINARARRRGFTGRLEVTGERTVVINQGAPLPFPELPVLAEVVRYETTITGEAPCYEGWQFLAALDSLTTAAGEAEWVVRCAPGVTDESVDRRTLRPGACDHCGTSRPNRRKLYLVRHVETGEYRQVGATCVKDFLGWQAMPVFLASSDLVDDELGGGAGGRAWAFTPRYLVTVALAAVGAFGWVSRSRAQYDQKVVPTFATMLPYLVGPAAGKAGERDLEVIAAIQGHIAAAQTRVDGQPLYFTPHDFRRLFITDLVNAGFPIHLAAKLVGHKNLDVTSGYTAVYQTEVFDAYEQHISSRRQQRPSEEYREPTQQEWNEFIEHFGQRKIALGSCHRPYGAACVHEHACIRCDFLQIDPAQAGRLAEIRSNLDAQVVEAERNQWLGDVDQLRLTIKHADRKSDELNRRLATEQPTLIVAEHAQGAQ